MNSQQFGNDDERFGALFQELEVVCLDDGFTESVIHRIERRMLWRKVVLASAAVVGGGLAILPLLGLTMGFTTALQQLAVGWNNPVWLFENKEALMAALAVSVGPFAVRWLEQ